MTTETAARKDIQKLQRAIVDGLEDVKAQDIQVFNTEHLSPLFERVIVASGSSNRQTKALAASVRDAVRDAGFAKPRTEGEENGEWIVVDCGPAVAHIMQPTFRQYYRLEDLWGEKPVRIRFGAPKPAEPKAGAATKKAAARKAPVKSAVTDKPAAKRASGAPVKTVAKKVAARKAPAKSAAGGEPAVKRAVSAAGKTAGKTARKTPIATSAATRRPAAKKAAAKDSTATRKSAASSAAPRKSAAPASRKG